MQVQVYNTQDLLPISVEEVQTIVSHVLAQEEVPCDEVAIHIVTSAEIAQLHAEHFHDSSVTDCISFPIDNSHNSQYIHLGDVFVCAEVAMQYAQQHPATDPHRELILYIIHGILHLIGYDDIEKNARKAMRLAEKRHMSQAGY